MNIVMLSYLTSYDKGVRIVHNLVIVGKGEFPPIRCHLKCDLYRSKKPAII